MKRTTRIGWTSNHFNFTAPGSPPCALDGATYAPASAEVLMPRSLVLSSRCFKRYSIILCSLMVGMASLVCIHADAAEQDNNAARPGTEKKELSPGTANSPSSSQPTMADQANVNSTTVASNDAPAPGTLDATTKTQMLDTKPILRPPKPAKNEISASADFLYGQGTVTMPVGFSLQKSLGGIVSFKNLVATPTRSSEYLGGTLSYSYGQAWYVDLSFDHGHSSGNQDVSFGDLGNAKTTFSIDDDWYQAYLRYTFPSLRGKRFTAYLRGGASYVQATLIDDSFIPAFGAYHQNDKTTDLLGNLGFGIGYSMTTGRRLRISLQAEGEGFFGTRSQESYETASKIQDVPFQTASINNTLYGGIGRATVHFEYRMGQSGLFKVFADAGAQAKFTLISYPGLGSYNELLWGPYVKLGIRYAF